MENLELIKYFDDESSIKDFCFDHNLKFITVVKLMKGSKYVERSGTTSKIRYYLKSDLIEKCKHLFNKESRVISKKEKQNYQLTLCDLTRKFLSTHFITPTRWGMTL